MPPLGQRAAWLSTSRRKREHIPGERVGVPPAVQRLGGDCVQRRQRHLLHRGRAELGGHQQHALARCPAVPGEQALRSTPRAARGGRSAGSAPASAAASSSGSGPSSCAQRRDDATRARRERRLDIRQRAGRADAGVGAHAAAAPGRRAGAGGRVRHMPAPRRIEQHIRIQRAPSTCLIVGVCDFARAAGRGSSGRSGWRLRAAGRAARSIAGGGSRRGGGRERRIEVERIEPRARPSTPRAPSRPRGRARARPPSPAPAAAARPAHPRASSGQSSPDRAGRHCRYACASSAGHPTTPPPR